MKDVKESVSQEKEKKLTEEEKKTEIPGKIMKTEFVNYSEKNDDNNHDNNEM